jgi:hypothetical protein
VKDGLTEDRHIDLVLYLNNDVFLPLWGVDQVGDREGDVSSVVLLVLFKDNVAPGFVEISGCHVEVVFGYQKAVRNVDQRTYSVGCEKVQFLPDDSN